MKPRKKINRGGMRTWTHLHSFEGYVVALGGLKGIHMFYPKTQKQEKFNDWQ